MADNIDYETCVDLRIIKTDDQNDLPAHHDLHDIVSVSKYDDTEALDTVPSPGELVSDSVSKYNTEECLEFGYEGDTRFCEIENGVETSLVEESYLGFVKKDLAKDDGFVKKDFAKDDGFVYLAAAQVRSVDCTAETEETKSSLDAQMNVRNEIGFESFFCDELHRFSEKLFNFEEYQFFEGLKIENQVLNYTDYEIVDDAAVIESVPIYTSEYGCSKDNELASFAENAEEYTSNDFKQGGDGKKEKRSRRKRKGGKKGLEINDITLIHPIKTFENGSKKLYSRKEMESLRFANGTEQKKKWYEVYCALGPVMAKEYDELSYSVNQNNIHANFDPRQQFQRKNSDASALLGDGCSLDVGNELKDRRDNEMENVKCVDPGRDHSVGDDSDGDGYYDSMRRPAFYVEGEPDFDSGPPEDGLEYLRRVRWEAAKIPNVKVVKPDKTKLIKEQTVYMPSIPDIIKCPEHLLPSKQWEDVFLSDFEALRQYLFHLEESIPKTSFDGNLGDYPTLSTILSMDSVTRVSMLKRRIKSIEAITSLSKNDCVWLFALCAAVDTPFDADMSASVRSLLRKCASLRAEKHKVDDEVVMLNILVTISGQFFGQAEK